VTDAAQARLLLCVNSWCPPAHPKKNRLPGLHVLRTFTVIFPHIKAPRQL
jgi:hypothetical protein